MSNIFDEYTATQLRDIFQEPRDEWPDDFKHFLHDEMAYDLLDRWLEQVDEDEYMEMARNVIEDLTYGLEDENGNELLDFLP